MSVSVLFITSLMAQKTSKVQDSFEYIFRVCTLYSYLSLFLIFGVGERKKSETAFLGKQAEMSPCV